MTDNQRAICLRAIDHFGVEHQMVKALEELGELATELARDINDVKDGTHRTDHDLIRGELADVIIMCEQLRIIYGGQETDRRIQEKLEYLWGLMRLPGDRMP